MFAFKENQRKTVQECEMCGVKQTTVRAYEVLIKESGTGGSALLCELCAAKAREGEGPLKIVEKPKAEKVEAPTICPLLSIAERYTDCQKERCWWYNYKTKKCVLVMIAMTLGDLVLARKPEEMRVSREDLVEKP